MLVLQQPEVYFGGADKLFDTSGKLTNDSARKYLQGFMQSFAAWIGANCKNLALLCIPVKAARDSR